MLKIFETSAKNLILMIFGVIFLGSIFGGLSVPKAEASVYLGCAQGSGTCGWIDTDKSVMLCESSKWCMINPYVPASYVGFGFPSSCSDVGNNRYCQENGCYDTGAVNGATCTVVVGVGGFTGGCNANSKISGNWDATTGEKKCIQCSGGKETQIYATTSSIATVSGDNKFDSACSGVSSQCDEQAQGCVGTAGFCNSSGAYTACSLNNCSGGACPAPGALTVTAPPGPIIVNTSTNFIFTVKSGATFVSGALVKLTGVVSGQECTTGSDGTCPLYAINSASIGTITVTASKSGFTDGTTTIAVVAATACPTGFDVGFVGSNYKVGDQFRVFYKIPSGSNGCIGIYTPSDVTDWSINDGPGNYSKLAAFATSAGVWKITISNGIDSCSSSSTCFKTMNVTAVSSPNCSSLACESSNPASCTCGTATTSLTNTWCCASNPTSSSGTFASKNACQSFCAPSISTTVSFDAACYQKTAATVAATANYSGVVTGDTIALYKPDNSRSSCLQTSAASGTNNYNLDIDGTWTIEIYNSGIGCAAAIKGSGVKATATTIVQAAACGPIVTPTITPTATPSTCTPACPTGTVCVAGNKCACAGAGMYTSPLMGGYCSIPEIITAAIRWILGLVSGIIILILIFGGITYVTSTGDEERIRTAKNTILYAIIGLAIILLAYTMIIEVKNILKIIP